MNGVRADVEWQDNTGKRTFFNIGVSDPEREAENALRAVQLPAVAGNRFVFVARDSAFAKRFQAALKAKDPQGKISGRIEVKLIADFLVTEP
jgi:hypothetical protein